MSLLLKKIIKVKNKKESLSKETGLALLYWGSLYNKSGHEFFLGGGSDWFKTENRNWAKCIEKLTNLKEMSEPLITSQPSIGADKRLCKAE